MKTVYLDVPFPAKGLHVSRALDLQPPGTTASAVNVRGREPVSGRVRGGQRAGLTKFMSSTLNNALPIQNLQHLGTTTGVPTPNVGDMAVPLGSGGSFKLFGSDAAAAGTGGTAGDAMNCACYDTSGNAYIGVYSSDASGTLKVYKTARNGTVAWTKTLATGVGSTPHGVFGICWNNGSYIYAMGTGASLSPVLQIWELAVSDGTITGSTYLVSESDVTGIRDQSSAQPTLNVLSYCNGFLLYPSADHVVTLYNIDDDAKTVIDLGDTNFGTAFTDITTDLNNHFYVAGYNSGTPVSGLAKINILGETVFSVQTSTVIYSISYSQSLSQLGACNTANLFTISLLTGGILTTTAIGGTDWAVVRNSGIGGFNVYKNDTTNNFVQYDSTPAVAIAISTLVGNVINSGVGTNLQGQPITLSGTDLRILGVAGGKVLRITTGGPIAVNNPQVMSSGASFVSSAALLGDVYYTDGLSLLKYDGATDTMVALVASAGDLPQDAGGNYPKFVVTWRERLWWYGMPLDPTNWIASAKAAGDDYDFDRPFSEETQAVAGNENGVLSDTGVAPGPITALIPFSQQIMLVGLDDQILMLADDPMAGGRFDLVTTQVGIAFGRAWCRDASGVLYFMSSRGSIYRYAPGALPDLISEPITELLQGVIDFSNTIVCLAWNEREHGFYVWISPVAGGATYNYFWDSVLQAWFQDTYADSTMQPSAVLELLGSTAAQRVVLLGSQDGYIRYIDPSATSDDGTPIASNVFIGPVKGKDGQLGILSDIQGVLGSGSGNVTWTVYSGDSAQTALSSASGFTGTFTASRNRSQAVRKGGHAIYVKLSAVTAWQLESLRFTVNVPDGKVAQRIY